jgi:tetratricopeptide (TPR) repeat protein
VGYFAHPIGRGAAMKKVSAPHGALLLMALVLSAQALFGLAQAAEPRLGNFTRYQLDDLTIYTTRSASQAELIVENIARFRVVLEKVLGKRIAKSGIPTHIVIVSETDWEKYLEPRQGVGGWFRAGDFANYMVMNGDMDRGSALYMLLHEYTHYFLASQFAGEYPPWFNEGLANLMASVYFEKNRAAMVVPMFLVHEARDGKWIPFERLIAVDMRSPEYQSHQLAPGFYAQAWLTVHYGMVGNRDFGRQMFGYLEALNKTGSHDQAKAVFGDLAAIDKQLRVYAHTKLDSGFIMLDEVPPLKLTAGKPVSDFDGLLLTADLMLAGSLRPERVAPLVESLQRRDPKSARAAVMRARLAQRQDDNAAFNAAVAQVEFLLTPQDAVARRELASLLLQSVQGFAPLKDRKAEETDRDLKRAFRLYAEALAQDGSDVETLWGFGTTAIQLDRNLDLAEEALVNAYQRAPANAQIALSLANLKSRKQEYEAMLPYLRDAIRHAGDFQTRRWATERLEDIEKYLDERAQDEAEQRQRQAQNEKELAEYEKKYGKPKKKR